jgi:hypothetical protein
MFTQRFPAQKEQGIFLIEQGFVKPELRIFETLRGRREGTCDGSHLSRRLYAACGGVRGGAFRLENRNPLLGLIAEAECDAERDQLFINLDALDRRVERLMRDALADGLLQTFVRTSNNTVERLVEQKEWREDAFGIPDIVSLADAVLNPGVDTEGRLFL